MKSLLHFHQGTIEIRADIICRFLQEKPYCSLTEIMGHLCDGFSHLSGTQRLRLWTEVRGVLHRMEERGLVQCHGDISGNMWALVDDAGARARTLGSESRVKVG